jgi:hypothetical protein
MVRGALPAHAHAHHQGWPATSTARATSAALMGTSWRDAFVWCNDCGRQAKVDYSQTSPDDPIFWAPCDCPSPMLVVDTSSIGWTDANGEPDVSMVPLRRCE